MEFDCNDKPKEYWALVLSITKAKAKVPNIPDYITEFSRCTINFYPFLRKKWQILY
jgi:hypothetical protein